MDKLKRRSRNSPMPRLTRSTPLKPIRSFPEVLPMMLIERPAGGDILIATGEGRIIECMQPGMSIDALGKYLDLPVIDCIPSVKQDGYGRVIMLMQPGDREFPVLGDYCLRLQRLCLMPLGNPAEDGTSVTQTVLVVDREAKTPQSSGRTQKLWRRLMSLFKLKG
jgi:hypothetical protein